MGWQPLPHAQHPWGSLAIPLPISHQRIKALWIKQKLQIKTPSLGRSPAPILLSHSSFTFKLAFLHMIIVQTLSRSPACSCWGLAATWAKPEPPLLLPPPQHLHHVHITALTWLPLHEAGWSPSALTIPPSCLSLGTPRVPAYQLYLNTDWTRQAPELLVIAPQGYEILWQHITLPNTGCNVSPCWSMSGSAVGICALWIQQHCVNPGGGKLFYEDVCCLFSCQKIQGLGVFALPSIHSQLFFGSCFSQNSLQFRFHWQLFPMSGLARFQTEQNFIAQSYSLVYLHMGEKGRVRDRFMEFCLLVTGSQVKTSPSDQPSADMFN